ncbi:MAG: polyprenol monophosphomannose synthase [Thermoanaerobaculia bacterium]
MTHVRRGVTVVVPTLYEVENLPSLVDRLEGLRQRAGLDLELLLMDDRSRDGSVEYVRGLGAPWVRIIERAADPGLSAAVVDGFRRAQGDYIVVMDADLSHPPEAIPQLLAKLDEGDELVIGSRFVRGGSVAESWGSGRRLLSLVARLLARPLVGLRDPTAGFFAFHRSLLARVEALDPIGFKIGLELIVKARCRRVGEVPIHFADRAAGKSKLGAGEVLGYLRHLRRLYAYRLRVRSRSA